jgi:hypothetical protein
MSDFGEKEGKSEKNGEDEREASRNASVVEGC